MVCVGLRFAVPGLYLWVPVVSLFLLAVSVVVGCGCLWLWVLQLAVNSVVLLLFTWFIACICWCVVYSIAVVVVYLHLVVAVWFVFPVCVWFGGVVALGLFVVRVFAWGFGQVLVCILCGVFGCVAWLVATYFVY